MDGAFWDAWDAWDLAPYSEQRVRYQSLAHRCGKNRRIRFCHNADVLGKAMSTNVPENARIYAFLSMLPTKASPNSGTLVQGSTRYGARTQATSGLSLHNTLLGTSSSWGMAECSILSREDHILESP